MRGLTRITLGDIAVAGMLVTLGGCATAPTSEPVHLVWPPPPLTARIEFVRSIISDEDLGRDTTYTQRLLNFLSGEKPAPNRIVEPMGLAVSDDGQRVYVSDFARLEVFVFDFPHKKFTKIGAEERLGRPVGIALDAQERLYVVEQEKKGISVFDRQGKKIQFITDPSIVRPTGIALDRARGKIYLADTSHTKSPTHNIKVFNLRGELIGTIGKGKGSEPGQFLFPTYLTVDASGDLYVTDTLNSRIEVFDPDGKYVKTVGSRGSAWGMFDKPKGVALDSFGNLYVADSGWSNVQIFNQKGQILLFFGGRGPFADYLNHRVEVYQLVNTTAADSFLNPADEKKGGDASKTPSAASSANEAQSKLERR